MRMIWMKRLVGLCVLLAWPAWAQAAGWGLDQLMSELAQTRYSHARFNEKKFISMLDQPVESSGELFYSAPDRLEKRTLKPRYETMLVEGGTLAIERGRRRHRLQLQDYPELAAFIDSIRGTLAGDRRALERNYRLSLDGSAKQWTLLLLPSQPRMQGVVKQIKVEGTRDQVRSIEVQQADGDSALMLIEYLAQ
ncbi:MAG: LolA-related protein [Thiobacillus sp.]